MVVFSILWHFYQSVSDSQSLRPLWPGARAASPRKKYYVVWKMRFAHFPHNIIKSGERRRREQAIVMEIRQTLIHRGSGHAEPAGILQYVQHTRGDASATQWAPEQYRPSRTATIARVYVPFLWRRLYWPERTRFLATRG